jgi:hypothetical protein
VSRFTILAVEVEDDGVEESFSIGASDDSLEAIFIARDEIEENAAVVSAYVCDGSEVIYVIDRLSFRDPFKVSGYVARRDGNPIIDWREARNLLRFQCGGAE